jgi:hypothetical protein
MSTTTAKYFAFAHLPAHLQVVSKPIGELAALFEQLLPDGPEKSAGMRKLLEAKDCFVRSALDRAPNVLIEETQRARLDDIGRVCHEVNRAYCQALGDGSQPAWEDAPEWQRESARMGVDLHLSGDFGPEASHASWAQQKIADGWTYGLVKDPELKQHPCLLPFDQLPREQQAKDFIFRGVVHALRA